MNTPLHVTVFDYGAGNLHSLVKALEAPGTVIHVETDPKRAVEATDALILPGVGAFAPAAEQIKPALSEVREALSRGLPCLGICLGMQLLFESSDEGEGEGIAAFAGSVKRLDARRVPHIGWNSLELGDEPDVLFAQSQLQLAWFANSFVSRPTATSSTAVIAWTEHEADRFPSAVRAGRVVGVQFHPEKSSGEGVQFVRAFLNEARLNRFSLQSSGQ